MESETDEVRREGRCEKRDPRESRVSLQVGRSLRFGHANPFLSSHCPSAATVDLGSWIQFMIQQSTMTDSGEDEMAF